MPTTGYKHRNPPSPRHTVCEELKRRPGKPEPPIEAVRINVALGAGKHKARGMMLASQADRRREPASDQDHWPRCEIETINLPNRKSLNPVRKSDKCLVPQ